MSANHTIYPSLSNRLRQVTTMLTESRLRRNIVANYFGTFVSVLFPLVTLPVYLNALGPQLWGLVSFVGLFVGMLSLLDAGISQAMVKEFAERIARKNDGSQRVANLLFGYERIYWLFALVTSIAVLPFANFIVTRWLDLGGVSNEMGRHTIYAAIAIFFVQLPGSIYRTVLAGIQQQVLLNKLLSIFIIIRHGLGVVLILLWPSLLVYLMWQVACAFFESIVRAIYAWRMTGLPRHKATWDGAEILTSLKFSLILACSVLLGILTMSIDKIYLSTMLPVEQLGYYSIAFNVAISSLRLVHPMHAAIQPKLVALQCQPDEIRRISFKMLRVTMAIVVAVGIGYIFLGGPLLNVWLRNESATAQIHSVLDWLLIGTAFNAIYNIGYINWVAAGKSREVLAVNFVSILVGVAVLPASITQYGMKGAGVAWMVVNAIGLLCSMGWMINKKEVHA
jgi:O-antigen/teichoic acid export membrane protein